MSVKNLQERINQIERQIYENQGNIDSLKKELERLKILAFEEEFIEDDNRRLLQE